jgi:hypothetical protein
MSTRGRSSHALCREIPTDVVRNRPSSTSSFGLTVGNGRTGTAKPLRIHG